MMACRPAMFGSLPKWKSGRSGSCGERCLRWVRGYAGERSGVEEQKAVKAGLSSWLGL